MCIRDRRAYNEEGSLKIITDEESTCKYSIQNCNFKIEDGIDMPYEKEKVHTAEWRTDTTYYIKCKDEFNNQPLPTSCSLVINAYDIVGQT